MSEHYTKIEIPRSSANDDTVLLIEWLVPDGKVVKKGQPICTLESSKTTFEVTADRCGFLFHFQHADTDVPVGHTIAVIAEQEQRPDISHISRIGQQKTDAKVTLKARKLIDAHQLDITYFAGIDIVREKHVIAYLKEHRPQQLPGQQGTLVSLTPVQRRAAKVLVASTQSIPHSYLSKNIPATQAEDSLLAITQKLDIMASISDWLVLCAAKTIPSHTKVNASWHGDAILYHDRINIGFALNQPNGELIVPVIANADKMDINAVVGRIRSFQKKAIRHRLAAQDFANGTITITSLVGSGVHQIMPIIFPGQAAIIAIGDRWNVNVNINGNVSDNINCDGFYTLTVAFDHRILNGTEAALFLNDLAERIITGDTQ